MTEQLQWLSRTRLVDEVVQVLRERIYSGRYLPGEALRQVQIAQELKVSRTPLREALRMLEREGIVKADLPGGVSVVQADFRRLIDAYELREVVDGLAARLAAARSAAQAEIRLLPIVERQRSALSSWEPSIYTKANVEFHAAIIAMADNEFLTNQMPIVRMTSQIFTPVALMAVDRVEQAIGEHMRLIKAIQRGDASAAERLSRQHIQNTIQRLKKGVGAAAVADASKQRKSAREIGT